MESLTSLLDALGLQIHLTDKKRKFAPLAIDQKLLKSLSKQAFKQGISLDALIYEKLKQTITAPCINIQNEYNNVHNRNNIYFRKRANHE